MKRVLVVEDDVVIRANILELLEEEGYEAVGAADGKVAIANALKRVPDVVVCDIMMPVMDGYHVLRALRDHPETAAVPFIFLSARAQRSEIREGMNLGADDYIPKPFTQQELLESIQTRLDKQDAIAAAIGRQPTAPPRPNQPGGGVVLRSPAMQTVWTQATQAAATPLSLLLLGETGTGKEVLAHAIHKASRREGPFVPLNCAALPETLLESELFGHEKGIFTGAIVGREGLFEAADGGTVFLDEIGDLPAAIQVKLLRVLEDRKVRRLGGRTHKQVDVRFIAATNSDLEDARNAGRFRDDLYFRVAGLALTLPPLRERGEEIEPLAARFIATACRQTGRTPQPRLAAETLALLQGHTWPGNVRELRNVIERTVALCTEETIRPEHLPAELRERSEGVDVPGNGAQKIARLRSQMDELERLQIVEALERCGGNQSRAAEMLGISRRTLLNRLDAFGLPRPRKGD